MTNTEKVKKRMHINERIDMSRRGEIQIAGPEQIEEYDNKRGKVSELNEEIKTINISLSDKMDAKVIQKRKYDEEEERSWQREKEIAERMRDDREQKENIL